MKTLVMIPARNEAENIVSVIREVRLLALPLDLLVIDDGSSDATAALAEGVGARVLRLPFNVGYGGAVQAGLLYARDERYDICALLDGDGQHDPKYIPDLIAPVASGAADLAVGSRFIAGTGSPIPISRRLGISLFSALTSFVTSQRITDPTSGFQAMGPSVIQFFAEDNYPHDFPDADTRIRLYFAGFRIREVPVSIRPRLHGASMHAGARPLYYVYKMLFSIFIVLTQRRMLRRRIHHATASPAVDGFSELSRAADHHPVRPPQAP